MIQLLVPMYIIVNTTLVIIYESRGSNLSSNFFRDRIQSHLPPDAHHPSAKGAAVQPTPDEKRTRDEQPTPDGQPNPDEQTIQADVDEHEGITTDVPPTHRQANMAEVETDDMEEDDVRDTVDDTGMVNTADGIQVEEPVCFPHQATSVQTNPDEPDETEFSTFMSLLAEQKDQ
ncbi:unnamed protein product [Cochlearia groenlandica]